MLRSAARAQSSTIRVLVSLLVVLFASGVVTLLDSTAEALHAQNRVVSGALVVGITLICSVMASRGLRTAVTVWCSDADIPFEVTSAATHIASIFTAVFWLLTTEFANMGAALPAVLALSTIAVWCAVIDQATMRIPTSAAYTAAALTLLLIVVAGLFDSDASAILRAVVGGFATALMYLLVAWATRRVGLGDVRLSLSLGFVLGYQGVPSVVAGLIWPVIVLFPVAIGAIIHRRITRSTETAREIAAGPGLVAGCALALALNG
ncbi:hypothetical protein GCM10020255_006200 [Rhodococcus baikonurensis]